MLCGNRFKNKKLTHQDIGQMDMYVRMFDDLKEERMIIRQLELSFVQIRMKQL